MTKDFFTVCSVDLELRRERCTKRPWMHLIAQSGKKSNVLRGQSHKLLVKFHLSSFSFFCGQNVCVVFSLGVHRVPVEIEDLQRHF